LSFSSARLSSDSVRNSRAETARSSSTLQMGPRSLSATSQCLGELSGAEENSTAETDSALAPNSDNMSMAVPVTETVQQMTRRRRTSFVPRRLAEAAAKIAKGTKRAAAGDKDFHQDAAIKRETKFHRLSKAEQNAAVCDSSYRPPPMLLSKVELNEVSCATPEQSDDSLVEVAARRRRNSWLPRHLDLKRRRCEFEDGALEVTHEEAASSRFALEADKNVVRPLRYEPAMMVSLEEAAVRRRRTSWLPRHIEMNRREREAATNLCEVHTEEEKRPSARRSRRWSCSLASTSTASPDGFRGEVPGDGPATVGSAAPSKERLKRWLSLHATSAEKPLPPSAGAVVDPLSSERPCSAVLLASLPTPGRSWS